MKAADVGGRQGFGPVAPEPGEPMFHHSWERDVFALTIAMGATGLWTLDRSRYMRETLPPAQYYSTSYYGIWFAALERLVADARIGEADGAGAPRALKGDDVRARMAAGGPTSRPGPDPAFALGTRVTVRLAHPGHHTRVPAYLRGRSGIITHHHGCHVFPDTNAHGEGEAPTPLYTVAFAAADVWGGDTTASELRADLFEPYLTTP